MKLLRVSGYYGVGGNEITDAFTKENSISPMPGPDPANEVSIAVASVVIKNWQQASHNERWQSLNAAGHTKPFL